MEGLPRQIPASDEESAISTQTKRSPLQGFHDEPTMSTKGDLDNDEYVAKLLAEDARKSSMRYSSMGMSALRAQRPTNSAPKPNTRFLKNLVREADTHNAALKKKEELEARIRLRNIREKESEFGHGNVSERPSKRRRVSGEDDRSKVDKQHHRRDESRRERRHGKSRSYQSRSPESRHSDGPRPYDGDPDDDDRRHKNDRAPSHRHRSRSHDRKEKEVRRKRIDTDRQRKRHDSPSNSDQDQYSERSRHRRTERKHRRHRSASTSSSTTSDPLTTIIGPLPPKNYSSTISPPRRRGRGFHKPNGTTSNIDHHFSTAYNPSQDTPLASDGDDADDWDNALEALRDRRAWQNKQADRMREAGFGEQEIERWEKSALTRRSLLGDGATDDKRDIRDVKWRKRGEGKEWDEGKVSLTDPDHDNDNDNHNDTKASQGRLPDADPSASTTPRSHIEPKADTSERSNASQKRRDDIWQRKDSGFIKQFRKALG